MPSSGMSTLARIICSIASFSSMRFDSQSVMWVVEQLSRGIKSLNLYRMLLEEDRDREVVMTVKRCSLFSASPRRPSI